eukprot:TRINITY_DN18687_c0_g1_i1.p1 TRINITY_DN18687_c0_g1~~TRINITY_DN18687_c0_g1_i1.p1  ORF type:complete len:236 (+),score=37.99 TRINITY_DN18687_c0_g1_i1:78-785(+)
MILVPQPASFHQVGEPTVGMHGTPRSYPLQPAAPQTWQNTGMLPVPGQHAGSYPLPSMAFPQMPACGFVQPAQMPVHSCFHQYFQLLKSHFAQPTQTKMATRSLNGQLFPLIVEAFKGFDTDRDNVLNPTEANVFFSHFVSEKLGFHGAMMTVAAQESRDAAKGYEMLRAYQANRATMDAQAFRALTSDEDGYLQIHEVVDALSVGTTRHKELLRAFGFEAEEDDDVSYYADHYA